MIHHRDRYLLAIQLRSSVVPGIHSSLLGMINMNGLNIHSRQMQYFAMLAVTFQCLVWLIKLLLPLDFVTGSKHNIKTLV